MMGGQILEDEEAHVIGAGRSNKKSREPSRDRHPFQKIVNVRQAKQDSLKVEDFDEANPARSPQRQAQIGSNDSQVIAAAQGIVDSYQYYGQDDEGKVGGSIDVDSEGIV